MTSSAMNTQRASGAGGDAQSASAINVGQAERWLSTVGGGMLTLYGLSLRSLSGVGLALLGGGLVYRGATGHCEVYQKLGISTADEQAGTSNDHPHAVQPAPVTEPTALPATVPSGDHDKQQRKLSKPDDVVQEASEESMDGSDAPAWTDRRLSSTASAPQASDSASQTTLDPLPATVPSADHDKQQRKLAEPDDVVQEASEESMDGSDPPAWTDRRLSKVTKEEVDS